MSRLDVAIVHNGIIRDYGTRHGLNDTQEYISKFLYPIYRNYKDFYKNEDLIDGIEKMTGSKFAILEILPIVIVIDITIGIMSFMISKKNKNKRN